MDFDKDRSKNMSSVEVSMMTTNHKLEPDAQRLNRRPQRSPPPPPRPTQVQRPVSPVQKIESPPSYSEITKKPVDTIENNSPTLLTEFRGFFDQFNFDVIREKILNREILDCSFNTVLWRVFLHCLSRDSNQWSEMLDKSRHDYDKLVKQHTIDPYQMNGDGECAQASNHPLSHDENSLWGQYFKDQELRETILKDIQRSFPDIAFFRDQHIIDLQLRLLFTHARHHTQTPYKQGMHDILGIVIYTIHLESLKVNEYEQSSDLMKKLYDSKYLEHDAFSIYEKIMVHLRNYYALSSTASSIRKHANTHDKKNVPFQQLKIVHIPPNENAKQINLIADNLKVHDKILHEKLEELGIEPTVYGTRWLRVLFSREIPFESIPNLWTVIFCFDDHFGFVNHFFIALIMEIGRKIEKQGEIPSSHFLQSLMKQNIITHAERVIRQALNLSGRTCDVPSEEPYVPPVPKSDVIRKPSADTDGETKPQRKLVRVQLTRTSESHLIPPITIQPTKSMPDINASNYQMDQIKSNVNNDIPRSPSPKPFPSNPLSDSVTEVWAGKTIKQQLEENRQLQENCADYMSKFIERIEKQVPNLQVSDAEDLQLQIKGLRQIAHVLKYNDKFNSSSFQAMVDFKSRKKSKEESNSKTDEQS